MKNELLHIGPLTIYGYGLMIAIGVIAAYCVGEFRAKKMKMNPDYIMGFILWTVAGGLVGAKILFWVTILPQIIEDPGILLNISDGFVVYGGIIAGIFFAWIYCKIKKIGFFRYFDLLIPSVALGQAFGRIGCFLAGCCYGMPTDSCLGVVFTNSGFAPNGVKLLPTQLFSSGLDFLHFLILLFVAKKKRGDGQVLGVYLLFYSIGRFILEYFRGDLERGSVGTLSTSQFIAIFVGFAGLVLIGIRKNRFEEPSEREVYLK